MRFFLIKDGSDIVRKSAYCGNDDIVDQLVAKESEALIFEEVNEKEFNVSIVVMKPSKDQIDWQTAKSQGVETAISFMAEKLGFE